MISANYFDGRNGKLHQVDVSVDKEAISLFGVDITRSFLKTATQVLEPFERAPCVLSFPDGSRCEVHESSAKAELLALLAYRKSFVMRWQDKWPGALLALVVMLFALFAGYWWGIPWAVDQVVPLIPDSAEKKLGDEVLAGLDSGLFQPSKLSKERQQQAQDIFAAIKPAVTRIPVRLVFRDAKSVGPNGLALPNGTIVVTDAMVDHITGVGSDLSGFLADEFAGVLAHEMGHIQYRHSLKNLLHGSVLAVATGTLFGDFSALAAAAPTLVLQGQYSREMETQADDYAVMLLKQHGISPSHMADLFESLEKRNKRNLASGIPLWMRATTDYLASHPPTEQRAARLRQAAGQ
ncbi:M48 family metallopeptidase [Undibacterium terreum]|uniref:Peptidase M48 n=1 Tax=Undibacterium terreum TaxID=1224302 RepID=A0A916UCP1_9BURK|nr:M48 family metallopeptidase [Undibacterium terreum]GGC67526.1 peptidase M48 [Undibacterium terreum]